MHKKLLVLALGLAGATLASSAQAHDHTGFFINGGGGSAYHQLTTDGYDNGHSTSYGAQFDLGWRLHYLGFELGYVDLGKANGYDAYGDYLDLSGKGTTLGLNVRFNPVSRWYLEFRGGAFRWQVDGNAVAYGYNYDEYITSRTTGTGWYAGMGSGVDLSRHWSIGGRVDIYDMAKQIEGSDNHVYTVMESINLEYRF